MSRITTSAAAALVVLLFVPGIALPQAAGPEFRVNSFTTSYQDNPSVAFDRKGNFVVSWNSLFQDGSSFGVFAQRYTAGGSPAGGEFRINTYTTNGQFASSVGMDDDGNFVVSWRSSNQDGSLSGIFAQRYDAGGSAVGGEFRVNTYTTSYQVYPWVSRSPSGNFVVVWASYRQDGSQWGVFGQRYDSAGMPVASEFRVNTYTTSSQRVPRAAMDASGRSV